jgi:hypothetical protein
MSGLYLKLAYGNYNRILPNVLIRGGIYSTAQAGLEKLLLID